MGACIAWVTAMLTTACGRVAFDPTSSDFDAFGGASCAGFADATFANTMVSGGGRVLLAPAATSGEITAVCDGGATRRWHALAPLPAAPYGKALVTTSETGYPDAALDATGLARYWSLDGSGPLADNAVVPGFGADATVENPDNAGISHVAGVHGECIHFDGVDSYMRSTVTIPSNDYTLMAWIALDEIATENHILAPPGMQFFVESNGRLEAGNSQEFDIHGARVFALGRWYHAALVQRPSGWSLYLDGTEDASGPQVAAAGAGLLLIGEIIGEQMPSYYALSGRMDEPAIFGRAMSSAEVRRVYERGALRIRYEARTCDALPCESAFVGPFSEATSMATAPAEYDLSGLPEGRYLEWRATLETDDANTSPELVDLTVR